MTTLFAIDVKNSVVAHAGVAYELTCLSYRMLAANPVAMKPNGAAFTGVLDVWIGPE